MSDGTSCTGGTCCSGACDTTTSNSNFAEGCRAGPNCVGTSWQYIGANDGTVCGGYDCRECSNGLCTQDDNTRCPNGQTCNQGTCEQTAGCTIASDCDDSNDCTLDACNTGTCTNTATSDGQLCGGFDCRECSNGQCTQDDTSRCTDGKTCNQGTCELGLGLECTSPAQCNDNNACTVDICTQGKCSNVATGNDQVCGGFECRTCLDGKCALDLDEECEQGEECKAGQCVCVPDCLTDPCAGDGCGNTCAECESGELNTSGGTQVGGKGTDPPTGNKSTEKISDIFEGRKSFVIIIIVVLVIGILAIAITIKLSVQTKKPPKIPRRLQAQAPVQAQQSFVQPAQSPWQPPQQRPMYQQQPIVQQPIQQPIQQPRVWQPPQQRPVYQPQPSQMMQNQTAWQQPRPRVSPQYAQPVQQPSQIVPRQPIQQSPGWQRPRQ